MEPEDSQEPATGSYPEPDSGDATQHISVPSASILFFHLSLGLENDLCPSGFRNKFLYAFRLSPKRATRSVHPGLVYLITVSGTNCRAARNACLFVPLLLPVSSLFSNTPAPNLRDQVPHPHKTSGNIILLYVFIFSPLRFSLFRRILQIAQYVMIMC